MSTEQNEPVMLFPLFDQNRVMREQAEEIGVKVRFSRETGAYVLQTEGVDGAVVAKALEVLAPYRSDEAREAHARERALFQEARNATQAEVMVRATGSREADTKREGGHKVYPALSQQKEFAQAVKDSGATSKYVRGRPGAPAHFVVFTDKPEVFAKFQGPEAEQRFVREFEDRHTGANKNSIGQAALAEVQRRSVAFYDAHKEKGFELPPIATGNEVAAKEAMTKLSEMRVATDAQLKGILSVTARYIKELREKEVRMRAEAKGMSYEEMAKFPFEEQKRIARTPDGKPIGLVGADFERFQALERGRKAMNLEAEARGIAFPRKEPEVSRSAEPEIYHAPTPQEQGREAQAPAPTRNIEETQMRDAQAALDASRRRGPER